MKIKYFVFIFISTVIFSMNSSFAQDGCNDESLFLTKGSKWIYNNYKKDKLRWISTNVLDSVAFYESFTVFHTRELLTFPNSVEGTKPHETIGTYICKGNSIFVRSEHLSVDTLSNGDLYMYKITTNSPYLEIPNDLSVGKELKGQKASYFDGKVTGEVSNRSVESYELVTTDAGTFKCFTITYNVNAVIYGIKLNRFVKEWFSKEVGFVKTEYYNKKGKLKNSKVLVEFSN